MTYKVTHKGEPIEATVKYWRTKYEGSEKALHDQCYVVDELVETLRNLIEHSESSTTSFLKALSEAEAVLSKHNPKSKK